MDKKIDLSKLKEPLPPDMIEWRIGQLGKKSGGGVWAKALCYLTSRAVHERLDEVCGVENWQLRYREHRGGTVCEIGIRIDGEWVWKAGGSDATDFEAYKGELSGAEKRAAVPWGIGRYLYSLPSSFVEVSLEKRAGWHWQPANDKKGTPQFWWKEPSLPAWALPRPETQKNNAGGQQAQKKQPAKRQPTFDGRPFSPEKLRDVFAQSVKKKGDAQASDAQRGLLVGKYSEIFSADVDRSEVMEYLFGKRSSKKLTGAEVITALNHVTQAGYEEVAKKELRAVYAASQKAKGQMELGEGE